MRELAKLFLKYSFFILFLFLEGISFFLIIQNNSFQKSRFINSSRNISSNIYKNLQGYKEYFRLKEINYQLLNENVNLKNIIINQGLSASYDSAWNLLPGMKESKNKYEYILARVINNSINKQYNYITLNAGRNEGLSSDMAVVSEKGVVGIIVNVSDHYSLVLPLLNRNFRLSAKIKRNNYFGVLEWEGIRHNQVALKEIPVHADVQNEDLIVTSGYSAIFPEGIIVGKVKDFKKGSSNFYDITVELATDFTNLYYVNVIKNSLKEEQLLLENN